MSNVIVFPSVRLGPRGFAGGMAGEALQASLSPADRKCIALWEYYRFGAALTCIDVPPPQRRDGGGHVVHVGKSGTLPVFFFIEGTMNAESLFAYEEEAKRQTLVRL